MGGLLAWRFCTTPRPARAARSCGRQLGNSVGSAEEHRLRGGVVLRGSSQPTSWKNVFWMTSRCPELSESSWELLLLRGRAVSMVFAVSLLESAAIAGWRGTSSRKNLCAFEAFSLNV